MKPLTQRQQLVYDVVKKQIDLTGFPPTRAEIARELGFKSANAAEEHLKALAKKGAIEMIPGSSRGIRLKLETNQEDGLPLIGRVAAGAPLTAIEHIEQYYQMDANLFSPRADFLLKVQGQSMIDIGILDGDLLAVHKTNQAQQGQIVVARVQDEVTVKRFKQEGQYVYLIAENKSFAPIKIDLAEADFEIEGLAVGVVRNHAFV